MGKLGLRGAKQEDYRFAGVYRGEHYGWAGRLSGAEARADYDMGMLLDPLADKLMVSAAYILLVAYNPRVVPPWIAVLVIGREFLVSGLRSIAVERGLHD